MSREIQDLCRKLKPVIGAQADRYWLAYLAEDSWGKRELETALQTIAARILGSKVENPQIHLTAPSAEIASGEYPLGQVLYNNRVLHPFGLREDEWIQHTAIFGRSGAGKTNTVFVLIENFLNKKKPFLIFDWKRNYRDLLALRREEVLVYTVGRETVPFTFNPLIPPSGTDPSTWLKKLIEIIAHSYYVGEGVMYLLQEAIDSVYRDFHVYGGAPKEYPTFRGVLDWLEQHPARGRKALWMDSALRCMNSICFGHMGEVVNTAIQPNLSALLEKHVILELDSLTNADKTLIIESMLLWIHHYRLTQPGRESFKHAMIIEEAHHILLRRTGAGQGGEAITDTILREIRELGEAIVLVDQHPSLISIPAMGNTYATVAMNVKHRSDVNALAGAMLLDDEQKELLGLLPIGAAVVKLQGRWQEPFLVRIPHRQVPKGSVDDVALAQLMAERNILQPYRDDTQPASGGAPARPIVLSEQEKAFLINVLEDPLAGTVERYRNLNLSRRKGNAVRESCTEKGLLSLADIRTRSGKIVLVELTGPGKQALRNLGREIPDRHRWRSIEHEYWKHKAAGKIEALGWTVTLEKPVNGYTDLVAERNGEKIAVEIETGKSDWRANLRKNLDKGFRKILILATSPETQENIRSRLSEEFHFTETLDIQVEQAQSFVES